MKCGATLILAAALLCGIAAPAALAQDGHSGGSGGQNEVAPMGQHAPAQTGQQEFYQPGSETTSSIDLQPIIPRETFERLGGMEPNESAGRSASVPVSELVNKNLVNRRGEQLGTVDRVVKQGGRTFAILGNGEELGLGDHVVAIPLDRIAENLRNNDLLMRGMSREDIQQIPRMDLSDAQTLEPSQRVELRRQ